MASYTETATIKVVDKSTTNLRKINREFDKLAKAMKKLSGMEVKLKNVQMVEGQLKRIKTAMAAIPKTRTATVNVKVTGRDALSTLNRQLGTAGAKGRKIEVKLDIKAARGQMQELRDMMKKPIKVNIDPTVLPAKDKASGTSKGDGAVSNYGAGVAGITGAASAPFRKVGTVAGYGAAYEAYAAGRVAAVTGFRAPLNLDDARARLSMQGRSKERVDDIQDIAERLSARPEYQGVTVAELMAAAGDVSGRFDLTKQSGLDGLEVAMERMAQTATIIGQFQPDQSIAQLTEQARLVEKVIALTGNAYDRQGAQEMHDAIIKGIIASGGDLPASDVVNAMRQAGELRGGIGNQTAKLLLLTRDEGGRRVTSELRQSFTDLFRTTLRGESKKTQQVFGIRDADEMSTVVDDFSDDFLGSVDKYFVKRAVADGVNLDNKGEVLKFLTETVGLVKGGGLAVVSELMTNMENYKKELERYDAGNPEFAFTDPTVRASMRKVGAQYQNAAAGTLEKFIEPAGTAMDNLAESLSRIASDSAGFSDYTRAMAGTAPLGIAMGVQAMAAGSPLGAAGVTLNLAGTSLLSAAGALTVAAGVNGAAGGGRFSGIKGAVGGFAASAWKGILRTVSANPATTVVVLTAAGLKANDTAKQRKRRTSAFRISEEDQAFAGDYPQAPPYRKYSKTVTPSNPNGFGGPDNPFEGVGKYADEVQAAIQTGGDSLASKLSVAATGAGMILGEQAGTGMLAQGAAIGHAIGSTAASLISGATVNVKLPNQGSAPADPGKTGPQ